jgi:nucleotide-binding universal stress UspA family protein
VIAVSRVIVGVSGSPGCLPAMRYAADVARAHGTPLIPVLAWQPPGGELAERSSPSPVLRQVWADAARQRLRGALHAAFGGLPADLPLHPQVVRGEPGLSLVRAATEEGDLLVIGTGRRSRLGRVAYARVSRYCLAHAACPVLAVPPSPLDREIGGLGLRAWAFRRRALHPADIAAPPAGSRRRI